MSYFFRITVPPAKGSACRDGFCDFPMRKVIDKLVEK